ncbi:hypothetical protein PUR23_14375 [Methylorubrum populi]|jgi:predicted nucleic acid-binding protein|uniref:Nucleic acid-binding protein n=1 Tax=Methylobacterium brachiatum TaxID=269660 RepID=A0AAJ1WW79_9HYPH|nr:MULTISPECIES: hypothetical protein [Methylobacterium]MCB4802809.1 hypothetical protein [Methylobacterium brachiatum]MDQ0543445.1 putative nucleic acid-binding protein [Methylobacterium brachiatum]
MDETNGEVGFLLDTNVYSDVRKGLSVKACEWYAALGSERRYLAWCVLQELLTGAFAADATKNLEFALRLQAWTRFLIGTEGLVFPTVEVTVECSRLRAEPKLKSLWMTQPKQAIPNSGADVDLAALSRITGIPIASENIAHFKMIHALFEIPGLYVPSTGKWAIGMRDSCTKEPCGPISGTGVARRTGIRGVVHRLARMVLRGRWIR